MISLKYKKSVGEIIFFTVDYFIIIFVMLVTFYPFWYVVVASISSPLAVASTRGLMLLPKGFDFRSYKAVFNNPNIWTGYSNTLFYTSVGTLVNMFMTILGAYALSRKNVFGKETVMKFIVFTMFFSGGLIPSYLLVQSLGIVNTRWALVFPGAISTYNLIILRTAFASIPESLEESARIDGANDFVIMFKIILPLAVPSIAVVSLYYAVGHWNSYFNAMIYLRNRALYPLQLILREILITNSIDSMTIGSASDAEPISETIKYSTIMVSTIPILCLYPFLQKYFVKGIMIGSIKG